MRIAIRHGTGRLELDVPDQQYLGTFAGPPPVDAAAALREALERPVGYPPLRRALTPGDHVAVLIDEGTPQLPALLVGLLDHVGTAGVAADSVTILCPTTTAQAWLEELPERHEDVHVEVHDTKDRRKLSYLATTAAGRRLYLNRTAVDADQLVVLSERRFDVRLGYAGAEGAIFPALADEAALNEFAATLRPDLPGQQPWPLRQEAVEVSWLLGQPFYVQVIASAGEGVAHVVAGAAEACQEAIRLLEQEWKPRLSRRAETVIVSLTGDPTRQTFAELADAVAAAARVVQPQGRIVLLAGAAPELGPGGEVLLRADEAALASAALEKAAIAGSSAARLWARSASDARLSVLGAWPAERTEELFATPLADAAQVQRLASAGGAVTVLEDAQRLRPVVE